MKRDIQGKFALKNDDYRIVRSLRLTDQTWKALGIASECLGLTRADYLSEIVNRDLLPCNTWKPESDLPCITQKDTALQPSITRYQSEIESQCTQIDNLRQENTLLLERATMTFIEVVNFEALRDRILFDLKLGRQASGYKAAQKALNRFITELKYLADRL